jgi:hypothetical protein
MTQAVEPAKQELRTIGLGLVAVAFVCFAVVAATNHFRHVRWHELRPATYEKFKLQLGEALPPGTPRQDVEAYLTREKIPFSFGGMGDPLYYIHAGKVARALWIMEGEVSIHIKINRESKVIGIAYQEQWK